MLQYGLQRVVLRLAVRECATNGADDALQFSIACDIRTIRHRTVRVQYLLVGPLEVGQVRGALSNVTDLERGRVVQLLLDRKVELTSNGRLPLRIPHTDLQALVAVRRHIGA